MDFWREAAREAGELSCAQGAPRAASGSRCRFARRVLGHVRRARFGLGAERRVTRSREFERLLKEGIRRSSGGYTFYLARRPAGPARLGILVSRRHSPRATVRNALKRCIREAFRHAQGQLGPLDVLVRPPFDARPGRGMILRLTQILERIDK